MYRIDASDNVILTPVNTEQYSGYNSGSYVTTYSGVKIYCNATGTIKIKANLRVS